MNKGDRDMEIKNFRVAYSDYDVTSTLYQKESAAKLAEQLKTVAPTQNFLGGSLIVCCCGQKP